LEGVIGSFNTRQFNGKIRNILLYSNSAVAGCALAKWSSIRLAAGRGEIAETTVNSIYFKLREAWIKIRGALTDRDTSF
jgi:hypothetical protein